VEQLLECSDARSRLELGGANMTESPPKPPSPDGGDVTLQMPPVSY